MDDTERIKSLIISSAQALWEDKDALAKFLGVVRNSEAFADMADALEKSPVRPADATFYGVKSREFQA